MGIALRHDGRLMPQEPLHLIQVYPGLNHPRCERMAKIVEMKIVDLRIRARGQRSPDIAPIKGVWLSLWKHEIRLCDAPRIYFQEIEYGGVHRDRPPLAVF